MKVLELFSGTGVMSAAFRARGHDAFTVDWDAVFKPDLCCDVGTLEVSDILNTLGQPDVVWMSPDCTTYSVMCISRHRDGVKPKSEYAARCDAVNEHVCYLIRELKPKVWFIENPVGMLRKMPFIERLMRDTGGRRHTITYCQYGERRQKPTDIFTNHPDPRFKPPCRRGAPCHDPAPRGSKTGTQGIKGKRDRAKLPSQLCAHIVAICEELLE